MRPDWLPNHPRGEGCVFALLYVALAGYAMLAIYVFGRLALGQ